jgi:hypothetical protein
VPQASTSNRLLKRVIAYIFLISIVCAFSSGLSLLSSAVFQWVGKTRRTRAAKQLPIAKYERNMQRTLLEHLLEDQFVLDRIPLAEIESVSSRDGDAQTPAAEEPAPGGAAESGDAVSDDDDIYLEKEEEQEQALAKSGTTYRSSSEAESETCPICLDDFEDGADVKVLPCQHFFHVDCINPWLEGRSGRCPLCKQDAIATSEFPCAVSRLGLELTTACCSLCSRRRVQEDLWLLAAASRPDSSAGACALLVEGLCGSMGSFFSRVLA